LELSLTVIARQKLARVFRVKPSAVEALERQIVPKPAPFVFSAEAEAMLLEEMLHRPQADYACPACKQQLIVRIFHRRDLDDTPLVEVKAQCSQCFFRLPRPVV
jgi:predicted RNA-binding Zn-ribbon protein involved in translation (DUF1610 family)